MSNTPDNTVTILPHSTPTEAEQRAWALLSREEQLQMLRAMLSHADCEQIVDASMSDVLAEARARSSRRRA